MLTVREPNDRHWKKLVREMFKHVSAKSKFVRYWQMNYSYPACRKNDRSLIVRVPVPKALLNHSMVSAPLVAEVMYQNAAMSCRRTRVVGSFSDGNSALMLVCARLRHVAGAQWDNKKYMNMKHLEAAVEDASVVG